MGLEDRGIERGDVALERGGGRSETVRAWGPLSLGEAAQRAKMCWQRGRYAHGTSGSQSPRATESYGHQGGREGEPLKSWLVRALIPGDAPILPLAPLVTVSKQPVSSCHSRDLFDVSHYKSFPPMWFGLRV